MIAVNPDGKIMVRRCLVTLRPFRLFVLGIGFFTLCFLMTSLGGQFSARRLGDSPFTIRTEVTGALESRGALRKMNELLELLVKRMDTLARLENSSEPHRAAGDVHLAADRWKENISVGPQQYHAPRDVACGLPGARPVEELGTVSPARPLCCFSS